MKIFNNFVITTTLFSAMAVSLVTFQSGAIATETMASSSSADSTQMMDEVKPATPSDSQPPMPTENDKMVMEDQMKPADTKPMMDGDKATTSTDDTKPSMMDGPDKMDQASTTDANMQQEDEKPWYKKWIEKLGM